MPSTVLGGAAPEPGDPRSSAIANYPVPRSLADASEQRPTRSELWQPPNTNSPLSPWRS